MTEAELYSQYKGVYLPNHLHSPESLNHFEEFTFRTDDIIIVTYPKSGTTWTQEIVPLIQNEGDMASVLTLPNWDRVPWLEEKRALELNLDQRPSPRIFASHIHYSMMPKSFYKVKPKVIYVMRNPKDVFTSSFHYHGMVSYLVNPGTVDEFLAKFLSGQVMYGSWFEHVKGWLNAEDQDPCPFLTSCLLPCDLKESVSKIAHFMGKSLSEEVSAKIADHCRFKNMKQNKMSNYSLVPEEIMDQKKSEFLRKGIIGDWKNFFTDAQTECFDAVYEERIKDVKLTFVWDLN
ncbi:hypothetical protein SKAU_G00126990 [Synaphobranchus kaupii]|uniref:Sulfotransferase n=1 Tax=Synaphobranchus kaupii TaxID=118154 RepID=A0A9Q1FPU1_SYNKA|nr:hypothetical protein SKAU_G00126990 [Synaphobranchus kaupii]